MSAQPRPSDLPSPPPGVIQAGKSKWQRNHGIQHGLADRIGVVLRDRRSSAARLAEATVLPVADVERVIRGQSRGYAAAVIESYLDWLASDGSSYSPRPSLRPPTEVDTIRNEGYRRGHARGFVAGLRTAQEVLAHVLQQAEAALAAKETGNGGA